MPAKIRTDTESLPSNYTVPCDTSVTLHSKYKKCVLCMAYSTGGVLYSYSSTVSYCTVLYHTGRHQECGGDEREWRGGLLYFVRRIMYNCSSAGTIGRQEKYYFYCPPLTRHNSNNTGNIAVLPFLCCRQQRGGACMGVRSANKVGKDLGVVPPRHESQRHFLFRKCNRIDKMCQSIYMLL